MTEIDVPDWVVEAAMRAEDKFYAEKNYGSFSDIQGEDAAEAMRAAITAALGAWVVPVGLQHRYNKPLPDGSSCRWFESSDADVEKIRNSYSEQYDLRTLYTLRQEKPE